MEQLNYKRKKTQQMITRIYLILLVLLFASFGLSAQERTITIGEVTEQAPGVVNVPVTFENFTNLNGFQVAYTFNPSILTPMQTLDNRFSTGGMQLWVHEIGDGNAGVAYIDGTGGSHDLDGVAFELKFQYTGSFEAALEFNLDNTEILVNNQVVNNDLITFVNGGIYPDTTPAGSISMATVEEAMTGSVVEMPVYLEGDGFTEIVSLDLHIGFNPVQLLYEGLDILVDEDDVFFAEQEDDGTVSLALIWTGEPQNFTEQTHVANIRFVYNGVAEAPVEFLPETAASTIVGPLPVELINGLIIPMEHDARLTIEDRFQFSGAAVEVDVDFSGIPADFPLASGISLKILFDIDKVSFAGYTSEYSTDWIVGTTVDGLLEMTLIDFEGVELENNTLLTLIFNVDEAGKSDLLFTDGTMLETAEGNPIPMTFVSGSIEVAVTADVYDALLDARDNTSLLLTNPDVNEVLAAITFPEEFITEDELGFEVLTEVWKVDAEIHTTHAIPAGSRISMSYNEGPAFEVVLEEEIPADGSAFLSELILMANPDAEVRTALLDHAGRVDTWHFDIRSAVTYETTLTVASTTSHDDFMTSDDGVFYGFVLAQAELDIKVYGDPALLFAFNGHVVSTGEELVFCSNEEVTVTLEEILVGESPITIHYVLNDGDPVELVAEEGDVLFGPDFLPVGFHTLVLTKVDDGYREVENPEEIYNLTITVHPEPAVLFAFNGHVVSTGEELAYYEYEEVTITLEEILVGEGPITLHYVLNEEDPVELVAEEGDVLFGPDVLPIGEHTLVLTKLADVNCEVANPEDIYYLFIEIMPAPVTELEMVNLLDLTGENLPDEIGSGGNARSAAIYMDRYVVVPSREGGPNVWVWDRVNPHLDPFALEYDEEVIAPLTFPINYVRTAGDAIYVSNLSLNPAGEGWAQGVFQIYRWNDLESGPEVVISYDAEPGRLGDAFSILGDPKADGKIIAHINTTNEFRVWTFEDGELINDGVPELITLDVDVEHMNNHGIYNPIQGEDELYVVTSNNMGIMIADLDGEVVAHMGTDIVDQNAYDPNIFYYDGVRYLTYTVNNATDEEVGAVLHVIDINIGETAMDAFNAIRSAELLESRIAFSKSLGLGHPNLTATNQVVFDEDGEAIILAHVVGRGFILETTGDLPATYALTLEVEPEDTGTVTGAGEYQEGATVPLTATPATDYQFVNWTDADGAEVSDEAEFHFTMPGEPTTLTANFEEVPVVEVETLAELRAMEADGTIYMYTGDAVIVAMDGFRNRKFIQDETAAIMIDDQPGVITTEYDLYDVITNVRGRISIFRQMVQFQPDRNTPESEENTPVDPVVFGIDELTSDDQAKLVQVQFVSFVGIEEGDVFENGQNYTITDGEIEMVLRTDFWNVDYIGEEIPHELLDITGVILQFNDILQLVPRFEADIQEATELFEVTFNVDLSAAIEFLWRGMEDFDPEEHHIFITGNLLGWVEPGQDPENQTMEKISDDPLTYSRTYHLAAGEYQYKYFSDVIGEGWGGGEWDGDPNRVIEVTEDMVVNNIFGSPTDAVNVDEPPVAASLRLYPNPASSRLHIEAGSEIMEVRMIDMLGQVVYTASGSGQTHELDVYEYKNGVYFVQVLTSTGFITERVQITK